MKYLLLVLGLIANTSHALNDFSHEFHNVLQFSQAQAYDEIAKLAKAHQLEIGRSVKPLMTQLEKTLDEASTLFRNQSPNQLTELKKRLILVLEMFDDYFFSYPNPNYASQLLVESFSQDPKVRSKTKSKLFRFTKMLWSLKQELVLLERATQSSPPDLRKILLILDSIGYLRRKGHELFR